MKQRFAYHLMPLQGWMNDPNGLIYYGGKYHVFFQYYPLKPIWGPMHWGHFTSRDLVHWKEEPIALYPNQSYDADGCFSGSAVVDPLGRLVLFYTGHRWVDHKKQQVRQVQCRAFSRDGRSFEKDPANPLIVETDDVEDGHIRDPKVFYQDGNWWMLLGARKKGRGEVRAYRSDDLMSWEMAGIVTRSDGSLGHMWECPDLFDLDDRYVLLVSIEGPQGPFVYDGERGVTGYFVGRWRTDRPLAEETILDHGPFVRLDDGFDFYAAQTLLSPDGRRLLYAWMDDWQGPKPTADEGWSGALTLPRELTLGPGERLQMRPARELVQLREKELIDERHWVIGRSDIKSTEVSKSAHEMAVSITRGDRLEIDLTFDVSHSTARRFGIEVHASTDRSERTQLMYDRIAQRFLFDRSQSGIVGGVRDVDLPVERLRLHLFIDRTSVELFVNNGERSFTARVYPNPKSDNVYLIAEGGVALVETIRVWQLKDIWSGLL